MQPASMVAGSTPETGALDHYRFAHAFDHLYAVFRRTIGVVLFV